MHNRQAFYYDVCYVGKIYEDTLKDLMIYV